MKLCAKCLLFTGAYICVILCPKREMIMSLLMCLSTSGKRTGFLKAVWISFISLVKLSMFQNSRNLKCVWILIRSFFPFVSSSILSPKPAPLPRHSWGKPLFPYVQIPWTSWNPAKLWRYHKLRQSICCPCLKLILIVPL